MSEKSRAVTVCGVTIGYYGPGVVSPRLCWICCYGAWMHTADTLLGLMWNVATEWKHDRHLCG
jgi:hypothetical protein